MQTEAVRRRRARGVGDPVDQRLVAGSVARGPAPPGTIRVSIVRGASRRPPSGSIAQAAGGAQRLAVAAEHVHVVAAIGAGRRVDQRAARRRTPPAGRSRRGSARPGYTRIATARRLGGVACRDHRRNTRLSARTNFQRFLPPPRRGAARGAGPRSRGLARRRARTAPRSASGSRDRADPACKSRSSSRAGRAPVADDGDPDALSAAPGRVASIVGAAERAPRELREQAEARARERIARGRPRGRESRAGRRGGGRGAPRRRALRRQRRPRARPRVRRG